VPVMSAVEVAFCRSAPWRVLARRVVLPWALGGEELTGDVLEIGGGSGAMADGIAQLFPDVRLTVTDIDDAMVTSARHRLAHRGNVTVRQADVTALPFGDASFDAVTSYLMLHHVTAWREALGEAARVLRPGGAFLGYDLTDTRAARLTHRLDRSPHLLLSADGLRIGLAEAGFDDVEVRPSASGHLMRFGAKRSVG
jgi:SAM-dependent methyltransferase